MASFNFWGVTNEMADDFLFNYYRTLETADDVENLFKRLGFRRVKANSTRRGYVSRRGPGFMVCPYIGRYGMGYALCFARWDTTSYITVDYWTLPNAGYKKDYSKGIYGVLCAYGCLFDIGNAIAYDYLTINTGRDGRDYVWYIDENYSIAADAETGRLLTDDEIEKLLA